jgi:Tol biopolymer transport system component
MALGSRLIAISSLVAIVGTAACTTAEDTDFDPVVRDNGVIVFAGASHDDGTVELYSVNEDGSDLRQLTDDGTVKTALAWSPDGSRLAYAALEKPPTYEEPAPGFSSIYLMDADGTHRERLCEACTRNAYGYPNLPGIDMVSSPGLETPANALAWAPNGSLVAAPAAGAGVLLIDTDTGEVSTIPTPEPVTSIAWSPDGRRLALSHTWFMAPGSVWGKMVPREGTLFSGEDERPGGIYLLDVETGEVEEVVSGAGMVQVHGWSSAAELLAFTARDAAGQPGQLSVYSVSERRSWELVPGEQGAAGMGTVWSPNGDEVAALIAQYDEESREAKDLWVVSSTGADRRALPVCRFEGAFDRDNCARGGIAWSPDGTTVTYRGFIAGAPLVSALILQDVDGSSTRVVRIDGPTFDIGSESACCFAWLPGA